MAQPVLDRHVRLRISAVSSGPSSEPEATAAGTGRCRAAVECAPPSPPPTTGTEKMLVRQGSSPGPRQVADGHVGVGLVRAEVRRAGHPRRPEHPLGRPRRRTARRSPPPAPPPAARSRRCSSGTPLPAAPTGRQVGVERQEVVGPLHPVHRPVRPQRPVVGDVAGQVLVLLGVVADPGGVGEQVVDRDARGRASAAGARRAARRRPGRPRRAARRARTTAPPRR